MVSYLKILGVLALSAFLLGCFQSETVVHIKPDGSGVIEETFLLSRATLDSMQSLAREFKAGAGDTQSGGKPENQDPIQGMIQEAQSKAGRYGPKVTFLSATPVTTENMGGYKAFYAFEDINTVKIDQNPSGKAQKPGDSQGPSSNKEEPILFKLVKGPVATLTVTMPPPKEKKKDPVQKEKEPVKGQPDPQAEEAMKALFKDMGIKVSIKIDGTIVKTNATHRHNSELTLFEMQFGKILQNREVFEKVSASEPKTLEEMKELVKGVEGLKIELNNPIVVEFK